MSREKRFHGWRKLDAAALCLTPVDAAFIFKPNVTKPEEQENSVIPKVIYQIFLAGSPPEKITENISALMKMNPDYDHVLFDERMIEEFIAKEYPPEVLATYRRINPKYGAARADLFRYLLIYKRGGVYLDIKSRTIRPLRDTIRDDDSLVLAQWIDPALAPHPELSDVPGSEYQNWHIIAEKEHPLLKSVIKDVLENINAYRPWKFGVGKNAVLRTTGPIAYTLAIHPVPQNCRVVVGEENLGLLYNSIGDHERLFKVHYSDLTESVVQLTGIPRAMSKVYFGLKLHLLLRRARQKFLAIRAKTHA